MLLVIAQDLPDMSILRLAGRIVHGDGSTALLNAVMSRQRKQPIVLDLAEVDTVDAHGLGLLAFLTNGLAIMESTLRLRMHKHTSGMSSHSQNWTPCWKSAH